MPLRAIFFDFGGTLAWLDPMMDPPWKVWVSAAVDLRLELSDSDIRRVNEEADHRFGGQIYGYHGRTQDFWRMRDMWAIDRLGITSRKQDLFDALQAVFGDPRRIHLYPETIEAIEQTRKLGHHVGVISNFTDALISVLKHYGLDRLFDSVTYSQAVGAQKPDPRVFLRALGRAECRASEAVHIGDSWESDYLGAKGAGLRAIWLNRDGAESPKPCEMIRDLHEVPRLLGT